MTVGVPSVVPAGKRKRPVAVSIVTVIGLVFSFVSIALALVVLWWGGVWESAREGALIQGIDLTPLGGALVQALYDLVSGVITLILVWGFVRMRSWAWISLLVWLGMGLGVQLVRYFYGDPNYLRMALAVAVVLMLNQAEVQEAFGIHRKNHVELPHSD